MFKKKITIITTIISVILTMTSCGNTTSSKEHTNTTISYSDSSVAEEIDTSSDASSTEEVDSTEDSSDTDSNEDSSNIDSIDESSETDSSEDDSSNAVTTTKTIYKETTKATTTRVYKETDKATTTTKQTTTQPAVTTKPYVAPTTQKPVVTTKPAVQTTKTTTKATTKTTTTTKKTETVKKDKYQLAFEKVGGYNNHAGEKGYGYTTTDLKTIREYYINYAVSKFGSRIRNCNKEFIPFYDTNGKLTHVCTNDYVPATWQYYYSAEEIDRVTYLIDGYLTEFLKNDNSDLTHTDYCWDVFWMIEPNTKSVDFSVAIFLK